MCLEVIMSNTNEDIDYLQDRLSDCQREWQDFDHDQWSRQTDARRLFKEGFQDVWRAIKLSFGWKPEPF